MTSATANTVHMRHLRPGIVLGTDRRRPDASQPAPAAKLNFISGRDMARGVTTPKRSSKSGATASKSRRTSPRSRPRKPQAPATDPEPAVAELAPDPPPPTVEPDAEAPVEAVIVTGVPEPGFAAHVLPPPAAPERPSRRRGIFFDVENTSRAADISRVTEHLALDWVGWATEFTAVGNWRVIGHDTARLLAQHGAALVHSAPSVGVRDWSDLRIAVSAGVWLAGARPGDVIEIVSDDQAFDAVGDVAASLGVTFRRTSYRALAGGRAAAPEVASGESRSRRSRRGGRRGRNERGERRPPGPVPPVAASAPAAPQTEEPHTAPHDELVGVVRDLLATSTGGVSLDVLANALRSRGFSRPPGSPRLITRLRRIKELDVGRNGTIRLVEDGAAAPETTGAAPEPPLAAEVASRDAHDLGAEAAPGEEAAPAPDAREAAANPNGGTRRRRRRGGRRRRGRRGGAAGTAVTPGGA